jgi:transcription elongation factor GreA
MTDETRKSFRDLLKKKDFEALESLWLELVESEENVEALLGLTELLLKAEHRDEAATFLSVLISERKQKNDFPGALEGLKRLAQLNPDDRYIRREMINTYQEIYRDNPNLGSYISKSELGDKRPIIEAAQFLESCLAFSPGSRVYDAELGVGTVTELNLMVDKLVVEFAPNKPVSFHLSAAFRHLAPVKRDHFLSLKETDSARLAEMGRQAPLELFTLVLRSFERPLKPREIKEYLTGIVAEKEWDGFWGKVLKLAGDDPNIRALTRPERTYQWLPGKTVQDGGRETGDGRRETDDGRRTTDDGPTSPVSGPQSPVALEAAAATPQAVPGPSSSRPSSTRDQGPEVQGLLTSPPERPPRFHKRTSRVAKIPELQFGPEIAENGEPAAEDGRRKTEDGPTSPVSGPRSPVPLATEAALVEQVPSIKGEPQDAGSASVPGPSSARPSSTRDEGPGDEGRPADDGRRTTDDGRRDEFLAEIKATSSPDRWRELLAEARAALSDDWPALYHQAFLLTNDKRTWTAIAKELSSRMSSFERLAQEVTTYFNKYSAQFLYLVKNAGKYDLKLDARTVVSRIFDLLDSDRHKPLWSEAKSLLAEGDDALLKESFQSLSLEDAEKWFARIDRIAGLKDFRREELSKLFQSIHTHLTPAESDEDVIYSTKEGIERKEIELRQLLEVDIPQSSEDIGKAREFGDLSENYEYKAAKEKQARLLARVAQIQRDLQIARPIDFTRIDTSHVSIGTRVKVEESPAGEVQEFTILGPWDIDPDRGTISHQAPFAQRLMGKKVGDFIPVNPNVPGGKGHRILEISRIS